MKSFDALVSESDELRSTRFPPPIQVSLLNINTSQVESIQSLISRAAHVHNTTQSRFIRVVVPSLLNLNPKSGRTWFIGRNTLEWASTTQAAINNLKILTGASVDAGTFHWLLPTFSLAGWTSSLCRFCLECLRGDIQNGLSPYERLLWKIAAVDTCPIHKRRLQNFQCCGDSLARVSQAKLDLFGFCVCCGAPGYTCQEKQGSSYSNNSLAYSIMWGEVLSSPPDVLQLNTDRLRESMRHIASQLGSIAKLASLIGANYNTLSVWLHKGGRINIRVIERTAEATGISIADILKSESPQVSRHRPTGKSLILRPKIHLNKLRTLTAAVSEPNTTLGEALRTVGLCRAGLFALDPFLAGRLQLRTILLRKAKFQRTVAFAARRSAEIIEDCRTKGVAATLSRICSEGGAGWNSRSLHRKVAGFVLAECELPKNRLKSPQSLITPAFIESLELLAAD